MDSIKETASVLNAVYSIILIVSIAVTVFIQISPYLLQEWIIDSARIATPILIAVLVSYILVRRSSLLLDHKLEEMKSRTTDRFAKSSEFFAVHTQAITYGVLLCMRESVSLKDFESLIRTVKKLDTLYNSYRNTVPLTTIAYGGLLEYVFDIGKMNKIPFDKICALLSDKLGKETMRRLIDTAVILENYGKECLSTWNELVK